MSFTSFFHASYWFAVPTSISDTALVILLVFFCLLVVIGVALKSVTSKDKLEHFSAKVMGRWGSWSTVMGFLGLLHVFLRYERTIILSYRFWLGLWLLCALFWAYRIFIYQTKKIPELRARHRVNAQKYAYLPRRDF